MAMFASLGSLNLAVDCLGRAVPLWSRGMVAHTGFQINPSAFTRELNKASDYQPLSEGVMVVGRP